MSLELADVTVVRGGRPVLNGLSLAVPEGAFVALLGPNGAGKSTLLRTVLGLIRPERGTVRIDGSDPVRLPPRERAAAIAWLPQHLRRPDPVPAVEAVATARFRFREPHARSLSAARAALAEAGAAHLADRPVDALSGGEAQRVALASLLAQEARTWLLDEPANHLDPAVQLELYAFLGAQWRAGRTILTVTHDVNLLARLAEGGRAEELRVAGLREGRVSFHTHLADPHLGAHLGDLLGVQAHGVMVNGARGWVLTPREVP